MLATHTVTSCLLGSMLSRRCVLRIRNDSCAGLGLLARTATMPAGKDNIISPDILTWHLEQQRTHINSHKSVITYHILTTRDQCTNNVNNVSTSDISSIRLIPLSSEITRKKCIHLWVSSLENADCSCVT